MKHVHIAAGEGSTALCGFNLATAQHPAWIRTSRVQAWRGDDPVEGWALCGPCVDIHDRDTAQEQERAAQAKGV